MKKVMALVLCLAVFMPIAADAHVIINPWWSGSQIQAFLARCHHQVAGGVSKGRGFQFASLWPVYGVGAIILSSQAWRDCKDQYPDVNDPRRANCQANMNGWVFPSLDNLSPVTPLYTYTNAPITGNGGNFKGGVSN